MELIDLLLASLITLVFMVTSEAILERILIKLLPKDRFIIATLTIILGAGFTYILIIAIVKEYIKIKYIKSFIPTWATILILPFLGFSLYWLRSRFRMYYGIIEFFVGFITSLNVFLPTGFDYSKIEPLATLQILGGLYIMVRGLDNIAQGVRGTNIEPKWKKIFGV